MQQSAVPFELTPRAFGFALVAFFIIVHAIRLVGRHVLPRLSLLREILALWFKRRKLAGDHHETLNIELRDIVLSVAGVCPDKIVTDEERNEPRVCGTRALLGPRDEE